VAKDKKIMLKSANVIRETFEINFKRYILSKIKYCRKITT